MGTSGISDDLVVSLRACGVTGELDAFDPEDDADLEAVAALLLDRFYGAHAVHAFPVLVRLTRHRLREVARRAARHMAVACDPDRLVEAFLGDLFSATRRRNGRTPFLATAYVSMCAAAVRCLDGERTVAEHDGAVAGHDGAAAAERDAQDVEIARQGDGVARAFHALGHRDRELLYAVDIDRCTYGQVSDRLAIPPERVGERVAAARARLARAVGVPSHA